MDRREFLSTGMAAATTAVAVGAVAPQVALARPPGTRSLMDVKEYGAQGDGSSDDTAAVQSAIDAANAQGGGVVWFPVGTFVTSTLVLHGAVTLQGTGWQSKLRLASGANAPVITTPPGQTNYYGAVKDLAIDGNRQENPSSGAHGIRLWAADHFRIEGVRVTACGGAGIRGDGDSSHFAIAPYISNCYVDSCAGSGLDLNSYTYDVKVHHVDIGDCDKGVIVPNSSFLHDVTVWGCNVGFYGYWAANAHLINCRAERSRYHGFWLDGCTDLVVEACRAYENNQSQGAYDGFFIGGSSARASARVSLVACHAGLVGSSDEHQRYGFSDGGSAYADHLLVNACIAAGNTSGGYRLDAGAHNMIGMNM